MDITAVLLEEFSLRREQAENVIGLIDEGNTIPFIARYRKEMTGSLDDQVLRALSDRLQYLRGLEKRKEEVIASITAQDKMTDELDRAIEGAVTLTEVEDLYRPYKQKRRTRASMAKDRGLEPLALLLLEQRTGTDPEAEAAGFLNDEVETAGDALQGAMDIIAETVSDDAELRKALRAHFVRNGKLVTTAVDPDAESVYTMYYDYSEALGKIPGHRILAADRGEREGFLKVSVEVEENAVLMMLKHRYVTGSSLSGSYVAKACEDSYSRLVFPSLEREIRSMLTERAAEQAISVFAVNLEKLLMQPPIKGRVVLGLDPAYRTGCKIAVVDDTGKVLDTAVVYPTPPQKKVEQAKQKLLSLIQTHGVTLISIGNGTASRESEQFVADLIKESGLALHYIVVSEAGASVYSASKLAAEEFPEFDVSLRSAVSIARRLQDPLAELVKIDPKAIGVGQYQHDMPKARMDSALGGVVEQCVNTVGVDLNTASHSLLSYVAGVNASVAKNIVAYREENGAFQKRRELMKVPKLGAKAFTQCAGFLRISEGGNVLDSTGVHPESYQAAESLLNLCGFGLRDVKEKQVSALPEKLKAVGYTYAAEQLGIGVPTLRDIVSELTRPGRDPRDELPQPVLRSDVLDLNDLKPGMELKGTVRNVIDFGAFVDIGVHEDGLVHISQICNRYIRHPMEEVSVGDVVTVWVLEVDMSRKRISLTMKPPRMPAKQN